MKTIKFYFSLSVVLSLFLFTSCGEDPIEDDPMTNSLIGEWSVNKGGATAYIDGLRIDGIVIETSGTITYQGDGTGTTSFTMKYDGESFDIIGDFNWIDLGFEVIWNDGGGSDEVRWSKDIDDPDYKEMTFTYGIEDGSTNELEITATMSRLK